jgi:hypothetical protein
MKERKKEKIFFPNKQMEEKLATKGEEIRTLY